MAEAGRLQVILDANTARFRSGLKQAQKRMGVFGKEIGRIDAMTAALAGGALAYGAKKAFDLGAAVEETASKFRTVFGPAEAQVQAFVDDFATMAGLSETAAKDIVATTGAIVQGMGLAREASADYAEQVVRLAGDLSSFNNIPIAETSRAIQAAITGEREQLKQMGIVVRETDVQKRALAMTGKEVAKSLTQEEKAMATLELISERAGVAVGDLDRTQASAANTARRVRARLKNLRDTTAQQLLPTLAQLLGALDENKSAFDGIRRFAKEAGEALRKFVGGVQMLAAEFAILFAQEKLLREKLKFWDEEGTREAVKELNRMVMAAEEVKREIIATNDAASNLVTNLSGDSDRMGGEPTGEGGPGYTLAENTRRAREEAERYRQALRGTMQILSQKYMETPDIKMPTPTLGTDPVELSEKSQEYFDDWQANIKRTQELTQGFASSFGDAMVNSLFRGKEAFTDFADHAIQQLLRIAAQAAIFSFLDYLTGGMFSTAGAMAGGVRYGTQRANSLGRSIFF